MLPRQLVVKQPTAVSTTSRSVIAATTAIAPASMSSSGAAASFNLSASGIISYTDYREVNGIRDEDETLTDTEAPMLIKNTNNDDDDDDQQDDSPRQSIADADADAADMEMDALTVSMSKVFPMHPAPVPDIISFGVHHKHLHEQHIYYTKQEPKHQPSSS